MENKQFKEIMDNFDAMKIGVDDHFKFHCNQCGRCCINREDILLTPRDIYNIAKEFGMSTEEVSGKYCEVYIGRDSRVPIVRLMPRGQIKKCPLLKGKKCSVHNAKPAVCAIYPIGRCLIAGNGHVSRKKFRMEDTVFLFTGTNCGDGSESHTVREWLETFGIPVEDEFFIKWQNNVMELSETFRKMEKMVGLDTMHMVWLATYAGLYLHYDTSKEFLPQFEKNAREYLSVLHTSLQ